MEPLFFKAENESEFSAYVRTSIEASMEPLFFKAENRQKHDHPRPLCCASMEPLFFKAENASEVRVL